MIKFYFFSIKYDGTYSRTVLSHPAQQAKWVMQKWLVMLALYFIQQNNWLLDFQCLESSIRIRTAHRWAMCDISNHWIKVQTILTTFLKSRPRHFYLFVGLHMVPRCWFVEWLQHLCVICSVLRMCNGSWWILIGLNHRIQIQMRKRNRSRRVFCSTTNALIAYQKKENKWQRVTTLMELWTRNCFPMIQRCFSI